MNGYRFLVLAVILFIGLVACTEAQAYLYDTPYAWPGSPNRVDDYIDSLYVLYPSDMVDVIVDFCYRPSDPESTFLATYGQVYEVFREIGAIAVRNVMVSDCYTIVAQPGVKLVEWDESVQATLDVSARAIKARGSVNYPYPTNAAWDVNPTRGYQGAGVTVGIIDSGVDDSHPALAGKFVAGYDAVSQAGGPTVNPDDDWVNWYHGTAVAGIVMSDDPSQQYMGVAPAARLVDCKIFNSTGQSQASYAVSAMMWCGTNRSRYGINVMCLAFGGRPSDGTDAMSRMADYCAGAGIVVVASAGNAPPNWGIDGPGAGDRVITVSAVTDNATVSRVDDAWDPVSQVGPRAAPPPYYFGQNDLKPEVSAYANSIVTCRGSNPGQGGAGFWQHPGTTGTSFATAHVAGVCAVLLQKFPGMPVAQVESQLCATAEARGPASFPIIDPKYNTQYGWGIVDAGMGVNQTPPVDVYISNWFYGNWTTNCIWAGHYPLKVGEANTLNARFYAKGGAASGVNVTFQMMQSGWGGVWGGVGSTTINIPYNGSAVATIPFTPGPQHAGHKCIKAIATYPSDPNTTNNWAQENMDVASGQGHLAAGRMMEGERYVFPLMVCVDAEAPAPRMADACICMRDLPAGSEAWIEPELPVELMPGQCLPCSLIVLPPEGSDFQEGDAVYANGWYWGNTVAEGGVAFYFGSAPPAELAISEIQYTDSPGGDSPMLGQKVTVSGVVTAPEGVYLGRFAVQDGEGPWSGLFVEATGMGVQAGDSITVTGTVQETAGLTEIGAITDFVLVSSANPIPEPSPVTPGMVDTSEAYEGVLVRLDSVLVVNAMPPPEAWQVADTDTCWIGRWGNYVYVPELGHVLGITGVVGYSDGHYTVEPRYDLDIEDVLAGVGGGSSLLPDELSLSQNRPNPFSPATEIRFGLPEQGHVSLTVYDVSGRVVRTLLDARMPAGYGRVVWDGTDGRGASVSPGVYFYLLKADGKSVTRRMVFVR